MEAEDLSKSMPRATRSGGPPQSAAVVNPTKKSSKKKRKARRTGTTQQPGPTSARANDDATGDAADARTWDGETKSAADCLQCCGVAHFQALFGGDY